MDGAVICMRCFGYGYFQTVIIDSPVVFTPSDRRAAQQILNQRILNGSLCSEDQQQRAVQPRQRPESLPEDEYTSHTTLDMCFYRQMYNI